MTTRSRIDSFEEFVNLYESIRPFYGKGLGKGKGKINYDARPAGYNRGQPQNHFVKFSDTHYGIVVEDQFVIDPTDREHTKMDEETLLDNCVIQWELVHTTEFLTISVPERFMYVAHKYVRKYLPSGFDLIIKDAQSIIRYGGESYRIDRAKSKLTEEDERAIMRSAFRAGEPMITPPAYTNRELEPHVKLKFCRKVGAGKDGWTLANKEKPGVFKKVVDKDLKEQYKAGIAAFKAYAMVPIMMFHEARTQEAMTGRKVRVENREALQEVNNWFLHNTRTTIRTFADYSTVQTNFHMARQGDKDKEVVKKAMREMLLNMAREDCEEKWHELANLYIQVFVYYIDDQPAVNVRFRNGRTEKSPATINPKVTMTKLNTHINQMCDFYKTIEE